ncbi:unnamed protein product, partial [Brassica napus]
MYWAGPVPFLLAPPPPMSAFSPGSSKAAATAPELAPDAPLMDRWAPQPHQELTGGSALQPTSPAQYSTSPFLPLLFFLHSSHLVEF